MPTNNTKNAGIPATSKLINNQKIFNYINVSVNADNVTRKEMIISLMVRYNLSEDIAENYVCKYEKKFNYSIDAGRSELNVNNQQGVIMYDSRPFLEKMKDYEVFADSCEDFCDRYHKPFPKEKWCQEQRMEAIGSYIQDLVEYGFAMIPGSATITGKTCTYYGRKSSKE